MTITRERIPPGILNKPLARLNLIKELQLLRRHVRILTSEVRSLKREVRALKLDVAVRAALADLEPPLDANLLRPRVIPIGIYLDTSDARVVREAANFWIQALKEEGFRVIAEDLTSGSAFITLFGETEPATYEKFKEKVARLSKKTASKFSATFENSARFLVLGCIFIQFGAPVVARELQKEPAAKAWTSAADKIKEDAKTAEDILNGFAGAAGIVAFVKKKDPKNKKIEDDDKPEK